MERYTYFDGGKWRLRIGDTEYSGKAVDRLAAYEETGLEPEEVKYAWQKGWKGALDEIAYEEQAGTILVDNPLLAEYIKIGPIDRLRELAQADSLIGKTVYEPNKRGFISTYEVISTHISKCSILIGWNLLDGVYSNLNGFEISALGKTVFLTREEAEAALRREQE